MKKALVLMLAAGMLVSTGAEARGGSRGGHGGNFYSKPSGGNHVSRHAFPRAKTGKASKHLYGGEFSAGIGGGSGGCGSRGGAGYRKANGKCAARGE